jgi:hypothetical protein
MQKAIEILFNGKTEILDVIDENSSIVKYLGLPNDKCGLIDTTIREGKLLGEGSYGAAYEITLPGMGAKKYVMKRTNITLEFYTRLSKNQILKKLNDIGMTYEDIKPLQIDQSYIDQFENAAGNEKVRVVMPPEICMLLKDLTVEKMPEEKTFMGYDVMVTFPKGSYLCENEAFSEYVLGVYLGKFYRENECINFFDAHAMLTCSPKTTMMGKIDGQEVLQLNQYIFMDKIDGDFMGNSQKGILGQSECVKRALFGKMPKEEQNYAIDSVYVQTIFAIAFYQEKLQMSHNDLHCGNLFVEYVTGDTKFSNGYVAGADFYHYNYYGNDLYFPATPMLAKIGDFGLSLKYSEPVIGKKDIAVDGLTIDGRTYCTNYFAPSYDSLYFSMSYSQQVDITNGGRGNIMPLYLTPLITKCLEFLSNGEILEANARINGFRSEFSDKGFIWNDFRPVLQNLYKAKTARELLEGPIAQYYKMDGQPNGKIVTLGVL